MSWWPSIIRCRLRHYFRFHASFIIFCFFLHVPESSSNEEFCNFPGSPAHALVQFSNQSLIVGTVAIYSCEDGFELLGPYRKVCSKDGTWSPDGLPFCVLNVATGKAPMQSSTESVGIPQKAVDGSTSNNFDPETCTRTKQEKVPWWYVNLLEPYMVQLVRLDFGASCCGKNKRATIVVRVGNNRPDIGNNAVCNRFTGFLEVGKPLFLPCNPPMPGAFVSVDLETPEPKSLSICEAFVYTDQALPIERCPQFRDWPPGSVATFNGKCYIFYNQVQLNFTDAMSTCQRRGGTLIDESSPALQGFISWELFRRHRTNVTDTDKMLTYYNMFGQQTVAELLAPLKNITYPFLNIIHPNSQYWMGAVRDQNDSTNWKWINGKDIKISFWNHPGGNNECAIFDGSKGWLWSDSNCHLPANYICQHQPKACGRPQQPPNSTMIAESFDVGSVVEYNCDEGHYLAGPTKRICLPNGFYSEFPPVCKKIQCGYPAVIQNGDYQLINGSITYLSQVVYKCNDGFKMQGRAELFCDYDERWDGPPPRCLPITCPDLPEILNGEAVSSNNVTEVGTVIEYSCSSPKFRLIGQKQIRCLPTGDYDNSPPTCKEEIRSSFAPIVTKSTTVSTTAGRLSSREKPRPFSTKTSPVPTKSVPFYNGEDDYNKNLENGKIPPYIIASSHPQDNEIPDSVHIRNNINAANIPSHSVEDDKRETFVSKLNIGAIVALGVFGAFVFLAAMVTTTVLLIRRNRSVTTKHYLHRPSPDCNTMASYDSSSSESRVGLSRYYRQAWENLHQSNSKVHQPVRRKETLDPRLESMRSGSELVVSDVFQSKGSPDKKKHHHHHHHHGDRDMRYHHQSSKKPRY